MLSCQWSCLDCRRSFSLTLDIETYEEGTAECPACRGRHVEPVFDDVEADAGAARVGSR